MDFKKATDTLFAPVTHQELADVLGVSVASIRQARLGETALARRPPPNGWKNGVKKLANQRIRKLEALNKLLE